MDISKELPNPLPAHWPELENKMRKLLDAYPLQDIIGIGYVFNREYADLTVVRVLKRLLEKFNAVRRFHVFYNPGEDGASHYYIFIDIVPGREGEVSEMKTVEDAWIKENLALTGDKLDFTDIWEKFELHSGHCGARVVVIDRNTP